MVEEVIQYLGGFADNVARSQQASSIILIGSFARGNEGPSSDADVVVVSKTEQSVTSLEKHLPASPIKQRVSLLPFREGFFSTMYLKGNIFPHHVITEGKVLYDNGFFASLGALRPSEQQADVLRALQVEREVASMFRDVEAFNGQNVYPAFRLYSILRHVLVLGVALKGEHVYGQDEALKRFISLYPKTREDVESLRTKKTYAFLTSRHRVRSPDAPAVLTSAQLNAMITSIERVIQNVQHS